MCAASAQADVLSRVKTIMRRDLKLGPDIQIADDMPFFGSDADIDSLDILLLLTSIEKEFGIRVPSETVGREIFQSVQTLVRYLESQPGITRNSNPPIDHLKRLPHGEVFRFITKIVQVNEGESAEGIWSLTGNEPFFAGHFPGRPIVPGVLIIEALAQLSGLAGPPLTPEATGDDVDGKLAQVDVRFDEPVVPPVDIQLRSRLTRSMGALRNYEVRASVGEKVVARGSLTLSCSLSGPSANGGHG